MFTLIFQLLIAVGIGTNILFQVLVAGYHRACPSTSLDKIEYSIVLILARLLHLSMCPGRDL